MENQNIKNFPRYERYKKIDLDWIKFIPESWEIKKVKNLFHIGRGRVISQEELLEDGEYPVYSSQTKDYGILGYINTYDFNNNLITWTTDGANAGTVFLRKGKFNCTNVCGTLQPKNNTFNLVFMEKVLSVATLYYKRPDTNGAKIMNDEMSNVRVIIPPLPEQTAIAQFLDHKTAQIDRAIAIKEEQIKLLNERKQIMIQEAVTKGLDPTVPMKDSGVEWIGEIPEHWEVERLFSLAKIKSITGHSDKELLSVYLNLGVVKFSEIEEKRTNATSENLDKYQLVESGDFVLNNQQAWRGSVGVSFFNGIVSPAYLVLTLPKYFNRSFANYLFRDQIMVSQYLVGSRGVGTIQRNLYWNELKNVRVPIPPLPEQTAIAQFLDHKTVQLDRGVEKIKFQIQTLKEYKTTLINEAVTGKIKVY